MGWYCCQDLLRMIKLYSNDLTVFSPLSSPGRRVMEVRAKCRGFIARYRVPTNLSRLQMWPGTIVFWAAQYLCTWLSMAVKLIILSRHQNWNLHLIQTRYSKFSKIFVIKFIFFTAYLHFFWQKCSWQILNQINKIKWRKISWHSSAIYNLTAAATKFLNIMPIIRFSYFLLHYTKLQQINQYLYWRGQWF